MIENLALEVFVVSHENSMTSASIRQLEANAHLPGVCILTRLIEKGGTITRARMVAQATKRRELRKCEWLLGYNAGQFNVDSHFNITYLELGWHELFNRGRWFIVPEKSTRTSILEKLRDIKRQQGTTKTTDAPESASYWPPFKTVFTEPDGIYSYRFVNVSVVKRVLTVIHDNGTVEVVRLDGDVDHPLLTLQSHIHPLHVILNAYPKIEAWMPRPTDPSTLEIIRDIVAIWEVWNSVPPTAQFLGYSETDRTDHSGLETPSTMKSRSHRGGNSLGKRRRADGEGGGSGERQGPTTRARRSTGEQQQTDLPSLELSYTSREASVDSLDSEYMIDIQEWYSKLRTAPLSPPRDPDLDEDEEVRDGANGSPKVTGYKRWEPLWDRRDPDTTQFSSNDWALLRNACDLSGEYRPLDLKDL